MPKILDRLTLVAVRAFMREARELRKVLKDGIDTYRQVNGLPPLYSTLPPEPEVTRDQTRRAIVQYGDFQTWSILEQLAQEDHVSLGLDDDLETIALARGWISEEGILLRYPGEPIGVPHQ